MPGCLQREAKKHEAKKHEAKKHEAKTWRRPLTDDALSFVTRSPDTEDEIVASAERG